MGVAAREGHQHRDRGAERRNLRQRQVDEDDAPLDHMHSKVGMDAGQDQARHEWRGKELRDLQDDKSPITYPPRSL